MPTRGPSRRVGQGRTTGRLVATSGGDAMGEIPRHVFVRYSNTGRGPKTSGTAGGPLLARGGASPTRSSGVTGTRFSSLLVALRSAATIADVATMVAPSPTPFAPNGTFGSGSSTTPDTTGAVSYTHLTLPTIY